MANLVDIVKDIISLINLNIPVTSTDGVRVNLCYTLHITLGKIVTDENGLEYKVTDIENNSWIDVEPYGHEAEFEGVTVVAPSITFLHGSPSSVNSEYLKLDARTLNKTPFIWLLESYEYDDLGKGSALEASFNARMFFMDWCDAAEWINDEHNDLSIKPMTNLANAFLNVVDASYSFKTVESSSVKVRSRFGVEVTNKGSERKIIDDDFSGVEVNVKLDLYDTEICCSASEVPNYVCYPVTYDITDTDGNTLYTGTIASGGSLNQEIENSTAVLKNTLGTTLSTTEILAEGSEDITAPNALVGVLNSEGTTVDGDSFASGTAGNLLAPDANYTVQYLNGTPIESGSIPSNTSKIVEVPDPITCADATVTLNSIEMTDIPSGDTENIKVLQSDDMTEVGSKQGTHWRIADSVVTDSDGTDYDVKAEESFVCTPYKPIVADVMSDMFEGRVLFDGGTFEDKTELVTNIAADYDFINEASLVLMPHAYKTNTIYALKEFNGDGDGLFTRAGTATRIDESGNPEVMAANVPRIDYSNGYPVLLLESAVDYAYGFGEVTTFNSEEGVLFVEMQALTDDLTRRDISISNGTIQNNIILRFNVNSNEIQAYISVSNTIVANLTTSAYTTTDMNKIAFKWKANDFALWVNGVEVATDSSGTVFPVDTLDRLTFSYANGVANRYEGNVKQAMIFKTALSDTDLQTLTTL